MLICFETALITLVVGYPVARPVAHRSLLLKS
ncbi:ABC transporter permease, partial [Methylobacterium radiotolerans]